MERNFFRDSIGYIGQSAGHSIRDGLSFGGQRVSSRDIGGRSSTFKSSMNLIKSVVAAGVLALPAGV